MSDRQHPRDLTPGPRRWKAVGPIGAHLHVLRQTIICLEDGKKFKSLRCLSKSTRPDARTVSR